MNRRLGVSVAALIGVVVGGCGSSNGAAGGDSLCPIALIFHHRTYHANPANAAVTTDNTLGQGRYPDCGEGHGPTGARTADVVAIPGVDPAVAVAVPSYPNGRYVWLEKHEQDPKSLPPVLQKLLN